MAISYHLIEEILICFVIMAFINRIINYDNEYNLISVPLASDEQLSSVLKKENYGTAKPITFYTTKLNDGLIYGSKATNEHHPFTKNNDFVKTFHNYKQVKL